jgi:hypothetical protein
MKNFSTQEYEPPYLYWCPKHLCRMLPMSAGTWDDYFLYTYND